MHRRSTSRRDRPALAVAAGLLAVLVVGAGCGGSDRDTASDDEVRRADELLATATTAGDGSGAPIPGGADESNASTGTEADLPLGSVVGEVVVPGSPTSDAGAAAAPSRTEIGKVVWWDGFEIEVDAAERSRNALSGTVNITLTLTNQRQESRLLGRDDIGLTSPDSPTLSGMAFSPNVPGGGRLSVVLDWLVEEAFVLENATLTFGREDTNQAVVPLGAGEAESFEPRVFDVAGAVSTPLLEVELLRGTLDASYASDERGVFVVGVDYRATSVGGGGGGYFLEPTQFRLELPSGSDVVSTPAGAGDLVAEAVYAESPVQGRVTFEIGEAESGTATLRFTDTAGVSGSIEFELP